MSRTAECLIRAFAVQSLMQTRRMDMTDAIIAVANLYDTWTALPLSRQGGERERGFSLADYVINQAELDRQAEARRHEPYQQDMNDLAGIDETHVEEWIEG